MSQADAKPLPFVYQFMAGKSQLPTMCGSAPADGYDGFGSLPE
jgi:hypothetical protein